MRLRLSALVLVLACCMASMVDSRGRELVLHAQRLRNLSPGPDIVPELRVIIDSIAADSVDDYYFAAVNVLIDQLFSDGRFAEADREAVAMERRAVNVGNDVGRAMSHRVRAQMLYKLSQPARAMAELDSALVCAGTHAASLNAFSTVASIYEWRWIVAGCVGDTAALAESGRKYGEAVNAWLAKGWRDPNGHFVVTALAFKASGSINAGDMLRARCVLDSASAFMLPALPARAYEHYYDVRSRYNELVGNYPAAVADIDTLLETHHDFPWFYVSDLRRRAAALARAGRYVESIGDYVRYAEMRDSMATSLTDMRLADLSALYRSELERQHRRESALRFWSACAVALLLLVLLVVSLYAQRRQLRQNRLLVERLSELDRRLPAESVPDDSTPPGEENAMMRLDRYMTEQKPFCDPSLSRRELAAHLGSTPEAVARLIRENRGTTVLAYINACRLDEARRVLESDSAETLSDIAARLGFGTLRTFQRTFSERYSMPPSRYRAFAHDKRDDGNV